MKSVLLILLGIIIAIASSRLEELREFFTGQISSCKRTQLHPWHDLDPGKDAPAIVEAFMEISRGSRTKYEIDKKTGLIRVDRVLPEGFGYPANYGFIPKTYYLDGDPLDILVVSDSDFEPGSLVTARVVGIMKMKDQGDQDDKILAVLVGEKKYENVTKVEELPINEIKEFFLTYKKSEGKTVVVEEIGDAEAAYKAINQSFVWYEEKFSISS
jgi:Inorganic pyrophosphatase